MLKNIKALLLSLSLSLSLSRVIGFFKDFLKKRHRLSWLKITKLLKKRYKLFQLKFTKSLKRYSSLSQFQLFAFSPPTFCSPLNHELSNKIRITFRFCLFTQKTKIIKGQFGEFLSSTRGFSIIGALVASAVGLIVVGGLTKMFVHMNSQISYLEKKTEQINLIGTIGEAMRNPSYCKETMKWIQNDLRSGKDLNELWQIRAPTSDGRGKPIIQLNPAFKALYGIKGIARFDMRCEDPGNDCSYSSYPETKQWSFNFISQSQINNVPTFNRIMKIPLSITFTGSNPDEFSCCQAGENFQNGACVSSPTPFTCPRYFTRWQNSNFCVRESCPAICTFDPDRHMCICGRISNESSRAFKKNIKLFKDYKEALKDIIKTPLYYYEYKKDHPQHKRRGLISEELPEHLQLPQVKKEPIMPDWPSIYGTLWAGIKALAGDFYNFKDKALKQDKQREKDLSKIKDRLEELENTTKKQIKEMTDTIQTKEAQIKEMTNTTQTKEAQIKEMTNTIQTKEAQIKEMTNTTQTKEAQIKEMTNTVQKTNDRVNKLEKDFEKFKKNLTKTRNDKFKSLEKNLLELKLSNKELSRQNLELKKNLKLKKSKKYKLKNTN